VLTKLVVGICGTAAITAAITVALAGASAAAGRTTPTCSATQLAPRFAGGNGGAGTFQDTWRLRNASAHTCKISGLATVQNYGSDGRPLRMDVTPMSTGPAPVVVLHPNQHAAFDLRFENPGVINCHGENPSEMTIQWHGAGRPVIVSRGLPSCHGQASESYLRHGN
jgi:hypothetical protein